MTAVEDPAAREPTRLEQPCSATRELLIAYQRLLDDVESFPPWVTVRTSVPAEVWRAPRFRWFAPTFLAQHMGRSVACLQRRHHIRCAIGDEAEDHADARALAHFAQALPKAPSRLLITVSVAAVTVVALAITSVIADTGSQTRPLAETAVAIVKLSPGDIVDALGNFDSARGVLISAFALGLSLCLITYVPLSALRLTRTLLNLYPATTPGDVRRSGANDHLFRNEGVYQLEDRAFGELGLRRPREIRHDLVAEGVLLLLSLGLGASFAVEVFSQAKGHHPKHVSVPAVTHDQTSTHYLKPAIHVMWGEPKLTLTAIALLTWSSLRLPQLWRARRRRGGVEIARAAAPEPTSVALPDGAPARWARRAVAAAIDGAVFTFLWGVGVVVDVAIWPNESDGQAALAFFIVVPIAAALVVSLPLVRRGRRNGRSLGKQLLGLRIVQANGRPLGLRRALLRELGTKTLLFGVFSLPLAGVPMLVDYLWPLRDARNRALHDRIASTLVLRT